MCQAAIGEGGVLLIGTVVIGTRPVVRSSLLSVGGQMDGITHAIGSVVVDQRWQNATVGLAISSVFLESNVTTAPFKVCDEHDEILSNLSINNVSIFIRLSTVAAVMKITRGIKVWV